MADHNLEIGLGAKSRGIVLRFGKTGAVRRSLRAFMVFLPGASICGVNFNSQILFEVDCIKTFFVVQADPDPNMEFERSINDNLNLIIDDELHASNFILAVFVFSIDKLKVRRRLIIEGIRVNSFLIWYVVTSFLLRDLEPLLIRRQCALAFVICQLKASSYLTIHRSPY